MGNTTIQSEQIADDAVTGAKIENAVTIATSVTSPLVDGQNFKVNGAQGSDGQVLTSTGSGVAWEDAAGGGVDGIGSNTTTQIITLSSGNKVGIGQNVGNAGALLHVYQQSGSDDLFKLQTASGTRMLMESSGKLGIGTSDPSSFTFDDLVLESGNSSTSMTIAGTNGSSGKSLIAFTNGQNISNMGFIGYYHNLATGGSPSLTNNYFSFGTDGRHRMRIDDSGNVSIGTDYQPSEKLDVDGTIRATNYKIGSDQGNDGDVLTSTGSGVAWEAPAGGSGGAWTAISTTTVTSAVSSIEFTLSGYEDYAFRFSRLKPSGGSGSFGRWSFSTDGGSNYSSNIIQAESRVLGSSGSDADAGSSGSYVQTMDAATTWGYEEGIMYLYGNESGNTVKLGHYTTIAYYDTYMVHEDGGFSIAENSAINKVKIIMSGQNIGSGEVTMYGISRS